MNREEIAALVRQVVAEATRAKAAPPSGRPGPLNKRVKLWMGETLALADGGEPLERFVAEGRADTYTEATPARLGVGRAGLRYRTNTLLGFYLDHAKAKDAVTMEASPQMIRDNGLEPLSSAAESKADFLRRPDLGRRLSADSAALVRKRFKANPMVQIVTGDGLSAAAMNANLPHIIKPLLALLAGRRIDVGTLCYVTNARVAVGDEVARLTGAEVLCIMVGERPGLKSAESMGAYFTYMKAKNITDAGRSMISNIHKGGLTPERAVVMMADTISKILSLRRSGVDMG